MEHAEFLVVVMMETLTAGLPAQHTKPNEEIYLV
jgi:hypothetical protein